MDSEITDLITEEKAKELLNKIVNQEFSVLVQDIKNLKAELQKRDEIENRLREQIRYLQALLFGKKSEKKIYIISDAMIASGASMEPTYESLVSCGEPLHTHIVCPVASRDGVDYLSKQLPHKRVTFWVGAIDEELTNKSYIVPGLGDAGNLAFGDKA